MNAKRKIARFLGLGAAGAAAVLTLGTDYMLHITMDREPPRSFTWISRHLSLDSGSSIDEAYPWLPDAAQRLRSCEHERVTIRNRDGLQLVGHWRCHPHARRAILAVHGWHSSWSRDFSGSADFLWENDCSILYIEQQGQGESEGKQLGFGVLEADDVIEWLSWLRERCDPALPIYLMGISMGATSVLMAAGRKLPAQVRGILADCGFTSPQAIWRHVATDNLHLPYSLMEPIVAILFRLRTGKSSYLSTTDTLKSCEKPVLLIHGGADTFVPPEMTEKNYAVCPTPKEKLIVPGASHGLSFLVQPERYKQAVRSFWAKYD